MRGIRQLSAGAILTFFTLTASAQSTDTLSIVPNPFSSSTTIHFDLAQSDTITLKVYDIWAQLQISFFDSTILPSGSYNISLIGEGLPDGLYPIVLKIGSTKTVIKKAVKNSAPTGIAQPEATDQLIIFPNPTDDRVTIPLEGFKTVVVADAMGNIVKSFSSDEQIISLSELAAGQYIITILTNKNEKLTTQRIMKGE